MAIVTTTGITAITTTGITAITTTGITATTTTTGITATTTGITATTTGIIEICGITIVRFMFATGISIVLLAFTAEKSMGFAAKWATADTSYVNCLSLAVVGWTD